jgi:hypothetical protein
MAKRKSKSRTRKMNIEPAVMTVPVTMQVPFGQHSFTADLSQMTSIMNRRFYRQGLNWAVAGFKVRLVGTGIGSVGVSKLPTTWTFSNSWTKGFRTWQEMNNRATDDAESVEGRFLDFKIYADDFHHQAGYGANLLPADEVGVAATVAGEWIPSQIITPNNEGFPNNSLSYRVIGVGDNYPGADPDGFDAVSLVQGYANSRALPSQSDPNTPAELTDADGATPENWMSAVQNEGTTQDSDVLAVVKAYDQPPYPYENDGTAVTTMYPGGATQMPNLLLHDVTDLTSTTISGSSYLKGGNFPCGLVRFNCSNSGSEPINLVVLIDLVPGTHRGYMAESMLEM